VISGEHRKHPKLARPKLGNFGRNEWAFVGAPCGTIQSLAQQLITGLSQRFQCAYLDASHQASEMPPMLASGASFEYTDAIQHRQLTASADWGMYQFRNIFSECDVILVNGNHHEAAAQVVIIDPSKTDSLKRRLGQLTNVRLFLLTDDNTPIFDFLKDTIPAMAAITSLKLSDTAGILAFFEREMAQNIPLLNGLVLAGGQSLRMGRDKGSIAWHGKPQREYMVDLLRPVCHDVLLSCRPEQVADLQRVCPTIPDSFSDLGPFGAILSAFRGQPDRAWLVVACDLPLLDQTTIEYLVASRSVKSIATAYQSTTDQLPEPLITIWEPKAYAVMLSFLAQGYSCPRKVLINSNTRILTVPNGDALQNVNTPEDLERMAQRPEFHS